MEPQGGKRRVEGKGARSAGVFSSLILHPSSFTILP
jgi:hypothetical protein